MQGAWLADVLRGYFAYYAVPTNIRRLDAFRTELPVIDIMPYGVAAKSDGSTGSKWNGMCAAGCP